MNVKDIQNVLSRFPGSASVSLSGTLVVDGHTVAVNNQVAKVKKGTKGFVVDSSRSSSSSSPATS
jgi:hypothetical protein